MLCPVKVNSNTIELTLHTSCYCVLDLVCVINTNLLTKLNGNPWNISAGPNFEH